MESDINKLKELAEKSHAHIKKMMGEKKVLKKAIHDELSYYFKLEDRIKELEKND